MSSIPHIALVVEGTTDYLMLEEALAKILDDRDFVHRRLQPEMSEAFQALDGEYGTGWPGVFRWCRQASAQAGGALRDNSLFKHNDLLIIQMDADVADKRYSGAHITDPFPDETTLPCSEHCPPASATTDRLRTLVLQWLGEDALPARTVLCTPSKALETWILVALFPNNAVVRRTNDIECRRNPETLLRGKTELGRLISGKHKNVEVYRALAPEFGKAWTRVTERCPEAVRFESDLRAALSLPPR